MSKISGKNKRAVVKIFISTLTGTVFLSSSSVLADPSYSTSDPKIIEAIENRAEKERERQSCIEERNKIMEAEKEIGEACKKAGLSGASCVSNAKSCGETSGTDSFNTLFSLGEALGLPTGNLSNLNSTCPQMSGRDYFEEKSKLEKEIKDTEKELADLNDDKADIEEKYYKEMQDIQKTLTEAQEDFKKKKLEIAKDDRERVADFMKTQNQANEELRRRGAEVLKIRGQLIQSQRDKALRLLAMTEASGKRACMKAVNDAKKAYDSVSASKSASHLSQAKRKRADLLNIYYDCMSAFDQQRIALNESKRSEQEELNNQLNNAQSSMDEIRNSLNLADTQLKEIKELATKEEADALQSVVDLGQRNEQQIRAAHEKVQKNLQTIAAKSQSTQMALNRINQSLMTLGPAPLRRNAEDTPGDASSTISAQINIIESIQSTSKCPDVQAMAKKKVKTLKGTKGTK